MCRNARARAKAANRAFRITPEDIIIPKTCPYLGVILTKSGGQSGKTTSPSLDRIDNRRGYTPDNIEIISNRANKLKNDATPAEALLMAKGFLERFS